MKRSALEWHQDNDNGAGQHAWWGVTKAKTATWHEDDGGNGGNVTMTLTALATKQWQQRGGKLLRQESNGVTTVKAVLRRNTQRGEKWHKDDNNGAATTRLVGAGQRQRLRRGVRTAEATGATRALGGAMGETGAT